MEQLELARLLNEHWNTYGRHLAQVLHEGVWYNVVSVENTLFTDSSGIDNVATLRLVPA